MHLWTPPCSFGLSWALSLTDVTLNSALPAAGETFDVSYLTVVPFFRVTESTRIGYQTTMMRRDLRPGVCFH